MSDIKTTIIQTVCKELNISVEDIAEVLGYASQSEESQEQKIKKAMEDSLTSILQDESQTPEQKQALLQKSINEFFDTISDFAKGETDETTPEEPENTKTQQIQQLHPDVKKALQESEAAKKELEKLKKSLELKEFEAIAKQYEVIGKDTSELSTQLYELKKSNESAYENYIAMLDEMLSMTEASGIFKEYGSNRAATGSKKQQAEQRIKEIMKSDNTLTYEQAFVKACEESEEMKKALQYQSY